MSYLYVAAVIALFYALMHFFTEMGQREKLLAAGLLFAIIAAAVAYNRTVDSEQEHLREVILKFNRHETLECGGVKVNDGNFTLSVGTQSFIAKEGTPHAGQIIHAAGCR